MVHVLSVKQEHFIFGSTPQPGSWFKLQSHVNDSKSSKALCRVRAGNAQLGNRYKDKYGCVQNWCPWCMDTDRGVQVRLSEAHLIFFMHLFTASAQRRSFDISEFFSAVVERGVDSLKLGLRA